MEEATKYLITLSSFAPILFFLVITLLAKSKRADMGRFWLVFFLTIILTMIVVAFIITTPDKATAFISSVFNLTNSTK